MIVSMWPSRSEVFDTVPALLLRLVLVLLDTGLLLRSRFEVASPSTGLDYIADVVALHVDGAEHPSGHVVPNIFIVLFKHVGANVFTAGTINVLADAVSAMSLRWLAVELGCSEATWRAVVSAYVWSPISMISCLSGSASSVQVAGILVAAIAAAAGRPILTGLLLALAIQCTGITSRIVSFVIPIILLTIQNSPKRGLKKHWLILCALLITFICATAVATGATSIMLCSKSNSARDRSLGVISRNGVDEQKDKYRWLYETQSSMGTLFRLSKFLTADNLPWTKLRPNLGIQWYLFAQAFPQFRPFYTYSFEAIYLSMSMMIIFACVTNPIIAFCALTLLSMMFSPHPTFGDISLWLALLPMLPSHLLEGVPGKTVLALSFVTCLVLNTASHELWLSYETGNANFFFGMNLAWFAWQAMTLSLLLRAQKALAGKPKQL